MSSLHKHFGTSHTTQTQKKVNTSKKRIASDYGRALPAILPGLLIGFVLFVIFGLISSFTLAHRITNLFGFIAVLCLFGCPILSYINEVKDQPRQRKLKADQQAHAERIRQSLQTALTTMQTTPLNSPENIARYADACDTMVYFCVQYSGHALYGSIVDSFRRALYERTWTVYQWNQYTGRYEYVPGIELADILYQEMEKKIQEFQARHSRDF